MDCPFYKQVEITDNFFETKGIGISTKYHRCDKIKEDYAFGSIDNLSMVLPDCPLKKG